ncbi:MAG TPA: hypothetical protein VHQ97_03715 [Solirubrobacterales bacterium]|nr:hypothetical protein [Solirubrobacterales bacterium]
MRPGRAALLAALLAAGLLMSLAAGTASADTRHPTQSLEFGVDGTSASKFNEEIKSIAYDQVRHRLWVLTFFQGERGKLYSFENPSPGVYTPRQGFPVVVEAEMYFDPSLAVDDSNSPVSGRVYVITNAQGEESVHAFEPDGQEVTVTWPYIRPFGGSGGVGFASPCGGDVDANGNLWVTLREEEKAIIFNPGGLQIGEMPFDYLRPCQIEFDPNNGDMFVSQWAGGSFYRHTAASEFTEKFGPFGSSIYDIDYDGQTSRLYASRSIFEGGPMASIAAYTRDGELVEEFGKSPGGGFGDYHSVAVSEDYGDVMIGDRTGPGVIRVYPPVIVPDVTTGEQQRNDEVTGTVGRAGAGEITECFFEYGTTTEYGEQIPCEPPAPFDEDRAVTAKIPGLVNETIYHYRLVAGNANGKGNGKDHLLEPHSVDSLRTEPATEIDRTTATLNASFFGTGEEITYRFEWGQNSVSENETDPVTLTAPVGATPISEPIEGLIAGRTYRARIVAEKGFEVSVANAITFSTLAAVKDVETGPATDIGTTEATLNGSLDPDGISTTFYFEYGKTKGYGHTVPVAPGDPVGTTTPGETPVETLLSDLEPGATYHFRLVGVNSFGETRGGDQIFSTFEPPSIDAFSSRNVTETSAELTGQINPNGFATTAFFEYGTTLNYGLRADVPADQLDELDKAQPVVVPIAGLEGVTYHFRLVAESEWGRTETEDQTFDFNAPTGCPNHTVRQQTRAAYLPDCRAYELVSPRRAAGAVLSPFGPPSIHASSPARFAFAAGLNAIPGAGEPINGIEGDLYVASRSETGWTTRYVGIPGNRTLSYSGPREYLGTTRISTIQTDLAMNHFVLWDRINAEGLVGPPVDGNEVAYIYDNTGKELGRLPTNFEAIPGSLTDVDQGGWRGTARPSPDFSHYFFSTQDLQFQPDGRLGAPGSVYDNDLETGTVTVVSKDEEGEDIPRDAAGPTNEYMKIPDVSNDGSHVLMSTVAPGGLTHLYMAVNNGSGYDHYDISRGEDGVDYGARLVGMTNDGSQVLFLTPTQLTADDTDSVTDLYRWDEQGNTVTRVSAGSGGSGNANTCGPTDCGVQALDVHGKNFWVVNSDNSFASNSGQAYFISAEELDGARGVTGQRNIYLTRSDGTVQWVATVDPSTLPSRMNVSPDGRFMAMVTSARLTSFDNLGYDEVYTYDAQTRETLCVSCPATGEPPTIDVEASQNGLFMSADGRTFFTTKDPLVARDANGIRDVYEYVNGRAQLISSGTGDNEGTSELIFPIGLVGVSQDGTDVYFSTYEELTPEDENGPFLKFYDARVNGGFLTPKPPAPCVAADECHGLESSPPAQPVIGTAANLGDGNARNPKKKRHAKRRSCHVKKKKAGKRASKKACKKRRGAKRR